MSRHSTANWARSVSSVQGHSKNQVAIRPQTPPPPPSHSARFRTPSPAGSTFTDVTGYSRQAEREAPGYHGGHFAHLPGPDYFRNKPRRLGNWEVKTTLPSEFGGQQSNNSPISTSSKNSDAIDKWRLKQEPIRLKQESVRLDYERQSDAGSAHPSSAFSRASGITDRTTTPDDSISVAQAPSKPPSRAAPDPPADTDRRNRYIPRR